MRQTPSPRLGAKPPIATGAAGVDELTGCLESLFRRYVEAFQRRPADAVKLAGQFRKELRLLIAQYGGPAVDVAIDGLRDEMPRSASLH